MERLKPGTTKYMKHTKGRSNADLHSLMLDFFSCISCISWLISELKDGIEEPRNTRKEDQFAFTELLISFRVFRGSLPFFPIRSIPMSPSSASGFDGPSSLGSLLASPDFLDETQREFARRVDEEGWKVLPS